MDTKISVDPFILEIFYDSIVTPYLKNKENLFLLILIMKGQYVEALSKVLGNILYTNPKSSKICSNLLSHLFFCNPTQFEGIISIFH